MSAIDFGMDITRKADPKSDRVAIGMMCRICAIHSIWAGVKSVGPT